MPGPPQVILFSSLCHYVITEHYSGRIGIPSSLDLNLLRMHVFRVIIPFFFVSPTDVEGVTGLLKNYDKIQMSRENRGCYRDISKSGVPYLFWFWTKGEVVEEFSSASGVMRDLVLNYYRVWKMLGLLKNVKGVCKLNARLAYWNVILHALRR